MHISKKNKQLIVQISIIVAIPLILLSMVFLVAVGIHSDQSEWFYSVGDVAAAVYSRERADESFLLSVVFGIIAIILSIFAYFVKREY